MQISKKVLGQLERAYATAIMDIDDKTHYFVASEGKGACLCFTDDNDTPTTVWESPGGTMNIVPVPGKPNEFFATQNFFPTFQATECTLVHAKKNNSNWDVKTVMKIPYLHRFDVFKIGTKLFFIGATLCEQKTHKDDWSKPGKVYVGELGQDLTKEIKLTTLIPKITKNHGFYKGTWKGKNVFLISGVEGVFVVYIPKNAKGRWDVEKILNHEVSDMATFDINADGIEELATIEPFHGSKGKIYQLSQGRITPIHEHEYEFGHVAWGGKIANKPSLIIGGRKGSRELICYTYNQEQNKVEETLIDNTGGPSNISVINKKDKDIVLAANREIGEIALYEIKG